MSTTIFLQISHFQGEYYDAVISKINPDGTYDVRFEGTDEIETVNSVDSVQSRGDAKRSNSAKEAPKKMSLSKQFLQLESEASPKKREQPTTSKPSAPKPAPKKAKKPAPRTSVKTTASNPVNEIVKKGSILFFDDAFCLTSLFCSLCN